MHFFALILGVLCCFDAFAATGRSSVRGVANQQNKYYLADNTNVAPAQEITADMTADEIAEIKQKEKERSICQANNIGIGNTFVWAARNSKTSNYSYMVEDTDDIRNNVCFVRVQMSVTDNRIDLSDIPGKYFAMGQTIKCGSWADEGDLEQRILDAKKKGRVLGTVAASVGGAAIGVGTMELFGNKLIGGRVQGQKALEDQELLRSQILVLKKSNKAEYDKIMNALDELETVCNDNTLWNGATKPSDCDAEQNPFIGLRGLL